MEKQQTAVQWLVEQIKDLNSTTIDRSNFMTFLTPLSIFDKKVEKARQMEKDQRESDYKLGYRHGVGDTSLRNMVMDKNK